jgi:hypothetical protein
MTENLFSIQQKNLVIAEFMNPKEDSISALKYHESWDWLMPVVAKIMRDEKWFNMAPEYIKNLENVLPFGYIEDVYESVWKFLIWRKDFYKNVNQNVTEIEVLLLLSPAEQEAFDVYESHNGTPNFDWGPHRCTKYTPRNSWESNLFPNAFLIGTCRIKDRVYDLLNEFDSTFGTNYLNGTNISSKIILKYHN